MKKILPLIFILAIIPLLSGCATEYSGNKLLRLPSGKPVNDSAYYKSMLLKKSMLQKDKNKLEESLISLPNTPIYIHSKILRMLVMPYIDDKGRLHTYQYVYFKVRKGGWLLGNYLMQNKKSKRLFNPLAKSFKNKNSESSVSVYRPASMYKRGNKKLRKVIPVKKVKSGLYNTVFQNDINAAKANKNGE